VTAERAEHERVLAGAELRAGDDVLDLCAGEGALTLAAHDQIGEGWVFAVDPSVSALEQLLRNAHDADVAGVMYLVGDTQVIPLPDATVDVCVTLAGLHGAADLAVTAAEIARVLRAGGRLSSCEPVGGEDRDLAAALASAGFVDVAVEVEPPGTAAAPSHAWVTARLP
jgi:ubiquinone/menaquinone biosynthesis C-methylase UbiE